MTMSVVVASLVERWSTWDCRTGNDVFAGPATDVAASQDAWNFSGMEQLVSVDNRSSAAAVKYDMVELVAGGQSPASQCQKKSAQTFLGDNANLVNLDNLISFPSSSPSRKFCAALCYELLCSAANTAHTFQLNGHFRRIAFALPVIIMEIIRSSSTDF